MYGALFVKPVDILRADGELWGLLNIDGLNESLALGVVLGYEPVHAWIIHIAAHSLQMKGRWETSVNVWFRFMYSQKWKNETARPRYFQNRISLSIFL